MEVKDIHLRGWAESMRVFSSPLQNLLWLRSSLRTSFCLSFKIFSKHCEGSQCTTESDHETKVWMKDFDYCCAIASIPEILSKHLVTVQSVFSLTINAFYTMCKLWNTRFLFPQRKKSQDNDRTFMCHLRINICKIEYRLIVLGISNFK